MATKPLAAQDRYRVFTYHEGENDQVPYGVFDATATDWLEGRLCLGLDEHYWFRTLEDALAALKFSKHLIDDDIEAIRARAYLDALGDLLEKKP